MSCGPSSVTAGAACSGCGWPRADAPDRSSPTPWDRATMPPPACSTTESPRPTGSGRCIPTTWRAITTCYRLPNIGPPIPSAAGQTSLSASTTPYASVSGGWSAKPFRFPNAPRCTNSPSNSSYIATIWNIALLYQLWNYQIYYLKLLKMCYNLAKNI